MITRRSARFTTVILLLLSFLVLPFAGNVRAATSFNFSSEQWKILTESSGSANQENIYHTLNTNDNKRIKVAFSRHFLYKTANQAQIKFYPLHKLWVNDVEQSLEAGMHNSAEGYFLRVEPARPPAPGSSGGQTGEYAVAVGRLFKCTAGTL
ncbi:MAG TPA: hypothetical protein PK263_04535, partial [bacterium]|nr:hypothetical protein [bacterium]